MNTEVIIASQENAGTEINMWLVVNGAREHVRIPITALADRRGRHNLPSDDAALEAIIKECVSAIAQLPAVSVPNALRTDVTIRQGTLADLPPPPPRQPTDKERLAQSLKGANSLAEKVAAIEAWAKGP